MKGLVFGSHVFHLTVTDSEGRSSSCTVSHGAVATDSNDIVITGDDRVDLLLGPLARFGANPWPWMDDRNRAAADIQIANLDTYYNAWSVSGWQRDSEGHGQQHRGGGLRHVLYHDLLPGAGEPDRA